MNKKVNFNKKMKAYSALAAASAMSVVAHADIVYTDIDPDSVAQDGNFQVIDMNNDANPEYFINANQGLFSSGTYGYAWAPIGPYVSNANIASGSQGAYYQYVAGFQGGSIIGSALNFWSPASSGSNAILGQNYYLASNPTSFSTAGQFINAGDLYIGVQFPIDTNMHFGWIRVNVVSDTNAPSRMSVVIKDYAYEDSVRTDTTLGMEIMTGDIGIGLDTINTVTLADSGDANTAADLEVSFSGLTSPVDEYRVYIVKSGSTLTDSSALALGSSQYVSVAPTGGNTYTLNPPASLLDTDSNTIANGSTYEAYVLAISPIDTAYNSLSLVSNAVTLNTVIPPIDGVADLNNENVRVWAANKVVHVSFNTFKQEAEMKIYAIDGTLVHAQSIIKAVNTVHLSTVKSGIYMVTIKQGSEVMTKKVVL